MLKNKDFFVVGIGASAGGLEAIQGLFKHFSVGSQAAFVIVQHLSPNFKSLLNELLAKYTDLPINKIEEPTPLQPGHIYLMTSQRNVVIKNKVLTPVDHKKENKINLPIDLFFHSLGKDLKECAIGIILSGTGTDGSRGIKTIHEHGGIVMVQHPEEAKFDGMPRAALLSNIVDNTLNLRDLSSEINRLVDGQDAPLLLHHTKTLPSSEEDYLREIIRWVHTETKIDFSLYRQETILRRLAKRMFVLRFELMKDYYRHLQENPEEAQMLAQDFLIGVSQFFRDNAVWDDIAKVVIPAIISQKEDHETIRVWSAACSTGEEAYTLGILFNEAIRQSKRPLSLKVFATDVNPNAISASGRGVYSENILPSLPASLLNLYFDYVSDHYQVKKALREQFVFATHNFLSDPPFINIDLISCRNALIYIQPAQQQKVLENFRFSLRNEGYLVLGKSEGVGSLKPAFDSVVARHKIYKVSPHFKLQRNILPGAHVVVPRTTDIAPARAAPSVPSPPGVTLYTELLAEHYAPDGVFVNASLDVLYIQGEADRYLKLPRRQAHLNLATMMDEAPVTQLRTGVQKVLEQRIPLQYQTVTLKEGERTDVTFTPFQPDEGGVLLVFITFGIPRAAPPDEEHIEAADRDTLLQERIRQLERILSEKEEVLQSLTEQLESSNEELQASNEELISSNEELQSSNEELQSMNEELYTVNTELQEKIEELITSNNDIDNLLKSTQIATLFLDEQLQIRMFTPALSEIIPVTSADIGRALDHFSINLKDTSLVSDAQSVLLHNHPVEREVTTGDHKHFLLRIFPYQSSEGTISGLVITLVDLTEITQAQQDLQDAKNYAESIVESVKDPLVVLDEALVVVSANSAFYKTFSVTPKETVNRQVYTLGNGQWNQAELRTLLKTIIPNNTIVNDYIIRQNFPSTGLRVLQLDAVRVMQARDLPGLILLSIRDITEKEAAQTQIRETAERLKLVLESTKTGIWEWDLVTNTVVGNQQWHRIFGYEYESASDKGLQVSEVMDRIHPKDQLRVSEALTRAMEKGEFYNEDFCIIKANGTEVFVNGQGSVIRDEAGTLIKMLGTNVDITERKQREERLRLSEERFTMAVSGTSDGVYDHFDMEAGKSWWSPRLYELLGLAPGEVEANANHFRRWVYPKDQTLAQKAVQEYINTGKPFDIEFRVKHQTLGYRWFRNRANIVLNDQKEVIRIVGALADIHQRKTSELSLKTTNRKLRVANEYLDNFVFMAAHDLRAPVTNLKSLVHLWEGGHKDRNLIVNKIDQSVARLDDTLSGLIQILDIQQYEQPQATVLEFEPIFQKLLAEMNPTIQSEQARITADFTAPSVCYIEPFLESILRNLISNALTYRSPDSPPEIAVRTFRDNGFVLLQVQDNGTGIDLKRGRDKLFKAFERLTREGEGKGIGLHLVKNMVEKNEGFIEVESEPGQGTSFKVYLNPYQ